LNAKRPASGSIRDGPQNPERLGRPNVLQRLACALRRRKASPPVNVLLPEKRLAVLAALVDGNSIRAAGRMTDVHQDTIGRFALRIGEGCDNLHNRLVRDLSCSLVEMDEQWGWVHCKGSRVTENSPPDAGEQWTWLGFDRGSRLAITYHVGRRDQEAARAFVTDLRARLVVMPRLMTSDGLSTYTAEILAAFGPVAQYAQTVKNYRAKGHRGPDHRYEPPRDPFITKKTVLGAPDLDEASTALIERNNLTARHKNGRMRRLCLAFSKKLPNHKAAVSLCYVHYNLCCIIRTLRVTPAMQAGLTDHVWSLDEFMEAVLSAPPCAAPCAQPLTIPKPEGVARELPNGRGFLRVVPPSPGPKAPPPPPPAAPVEPAPTAAGANPSPVPKPAAPLRLVPREPEQLGLFDPPPKA
jgi:IS1 family transposase